MERWTSGAAATLWSRDGDDAGVGRCTSMLNVAAEAARKAGMTNVETRVMNAENLELDADSFDAVVCRIALMLFPNPAQALAEMRRVVKPGGKVTVMVYAALEKNPFWEIFHKTVRRLGNIPPPAPDEPSD